MAHLANDVALFHDGVALVLEGADGAAHCLHGALPDIWGRWPEQGSGGGGHSYGERNQMWQRGQEMAPYCLMIE